MALTVGLSLVVLLSFAAVAVDLGYARMVDVELQNAADAAAHAAVQRLDGTDAGLASARAVAVDVAAANTAGGSRVTLDPNVTNASDGDLVLGIWDGATFTPSIDATKVNAARAHTEIPALGTFFANVFGQREVAVGARTTMVAEHGGASEVECVLPLAIPDCLIGYHGGLTELADVELGLSPAGIDSVSWGRPNGRPNASWSRDQILDCEGSGPAAVGDPVGLQNGVATSAMAALIAAISTSPTTWREETWGDLPGRMPGSDIPVSAFGHTVEGPLMVFDGGDEYCTGGGGSFTGTETITGFMWGSVYDVKLPAGGRGGGAGTVGTLRLRLDPMGDHEFGTAGGGPDWGVVGWTPPRMVE